MWKLSFLVTVAFTLLWAPMAQAGRDVTGPLDTVVGVPDDGDWPPNELPPFAVDDQVLTKYLHFKGFQQPTGIRVTPAAGPTVVTGLTFTTANDATERDPVEYELSGSNASIDGPYTLIAEGPIVDFAGGTAWNRRTKTTTPIQFDNDIAYEHYQILFPAVRDPGTANSMQIAEIELLANVFTATNPSPADGAIGVTAPLMQWTAGDTGTQHDVYFGTDPDAVAGADATDTTGIYRGRLGWLLYYHIPGLDTGTTYYWRVDEVEPDGTTIHTGDVWSFTSAMLTAYAPDPTDGAKWVPTNAQLSWTMGAKAKSHDVYFGTDEAAVAAADPSVSKGNQLEPWYDPGALAEDTTYYWRIDEIEDDGTKQIGAVWRFTTLGAGGGIKGDYYNNTTLSGAPAMTRIDPEVNFDWGDGGPGGPIPADGWSARWTADLEIDIADTFTFSVRSQDGTRLWIDGELILDMWVAWVTTEYASLPIYLEAGIHSLRLEFFDGGEPGGTAAVQELYWATPTKAKEIVPAGPLQPPLRAGSPSPGDGDTGVKETPTLRWAAGQQAAQHDVYFGTDEDAVAAADTTTVGVYRGRQTSTSYVPTEAPLEWEKTYYWKINEVNGVDVWEGNVWSFTVADYVVVDDFEDYNDYSPDRIFQTWIDGFGYTDPPPGRQGNGTGSTVGYLAAPFAEQTIVHGGAQSMPYGFDLTVFPFYAEAEREFPVAQDFSRKGVMSLSMWVYGDPCSAPAPLYIGLQDSAGTRIDVPDTISSRVQTTSWQEVHFELSKFAPVNLASVKKMYIGVGNRLFPSVGGTGNLLVDDIGLYRPRCVAELLKPVNDLNDDCAVDYLDLDIVVNEWLGTGYLVTPVDPGASGLVAHYEFEGNANDSAGANNGIPSGGPTYALGKVGQAINLNGTNHYVNCGTGLDLTGSVTVSAWIKLSGTGVDQKVAGNQDGATGGYKMTVFSDDRVEFEIRTSANAAVLNRGVAGGTAMVPGVWYHVVGVYSEGNYIRTYVDGDLDREMTTSEILGSSTGPLMIGIEPFPAADGTYGGFFNGLIDELKIYSRALSDAEVAWLAGRTDPFSEPFDFNVDDTVDFLDVAILGDEWLEELTWPVP